MQLTEKKTVYIVSGYMRSGTSMMMKCLSAGGLTAVFSSHKDTYLNDKYKRDHYMPNPEGFFELGRKAFIPSDFPVAFSGKLIKVLHWRLKELPDYHYKVIFMERDPVEIEISYLNMFQRRPPFVLQKYEELLDGIYETLEQRTDVSYDRVNHHDVIHDTKTVFTRLRESNWPITNLQQAIKSVNPNLYRSKTKDLKIVRESIPGLRTDLPDILKQKKNS